MKVEVIENLPFDEYLKLPRLSSSALKDFIHSPMYYKWRKTNPMKETKAMATGTMIHTWLLENHKFNCEYAIKPDYEIPEKPMSDMRKADKGTKEKYKIKKDAYESAITAWADANSGKKVIDKELIDKFKHLKPYNHTKNEVTVLFTYMGVDCKARFDVLHTDKHWVEDIKSTADIFRVKRQFIDLKYYVQSGFYQIAYNEAFGQYPDEFVFTFISTNDFVVKETFKMDFAFMELGREVAHTNILNFKDALEKDEWPLGIETTLEIPNWL